MSEQKASNPAPDLQRLEELEANLHLRVSEAGNPATPAHLLAILARDQDAVVRENVAGNPNTPWKTLERLAWEFPRAFLHNPAGQMQMLAHPEQIPTNGTFWDGLLREASLPPWWWNWLSNHPALRGRPSVSLHIQSAGETSHSYGAPEEGENTLLTLVELLTATSAQGGSLPDHMVPDRLRTIWEQVVREHLQRLAQRGSGKTRQTVARNSYTSVVVLQMLAHDQEDSVRAAVAWNMRAPVDLLRILAQDHAEEVRKAVTSNLQTPVEILRTLAQDHVRGVRRAVASNRQTPSELLRTLAQDQDERVREAVVGNPQTPVEVLRTLAQDQIGLVRSAVARNSQTPTEVLRTLAQDQDQGVRRAAAQHPQISVELLCILTQDPSEGVRSAVGGNPQTPVEVLRTLAQDPSEGVRRATASNPQTPVELLSTLAHDQAGFVRNLVVRNPQTPVEVLRALTHDQDDEVRRLAHFVLRLLVEAERLGHEEQEKHWRKQLRQFVQGAHGPYGITVLSGELLLSKITGLGLPEQVRQSILAALVTDWDGTMIQTAFSRYVGSERFIANCFPLFTPPIVLQRFAASSSWQVRYLVALHPRTPWETRQCLSQDGNRYVRAMARAKAAQIAEEGTGGNAHETLLPPL